MRTCPLCGQEYSEPPALSRRDNKTEICSLCGVREALTAFGISSEEIEEIVAAIRAKTPHPTAYSPQAGD